MRLSRRRLLVVGLVCLVVVATVAVLARRAAIAYCAIRLSEAVTQPVHDRYVRLLARVSTEKELLDFIVGRPGFLWPSGRLQGIGEEALGLKDTDEAHAILEGLLEEERHRVTALIALSFSETYGPKRLFDRYEGDENGLWAVAVVYMMSGRTDVLPCLEDYYARYLHHAKDPPGSIHYPRMKVRAFLSAHGIDPDAVASDREVSDEQR